MLINVGEAPFTLEQRKGQYTHRIVETVPTAIQMLTSETSRYLRETLLARSTATTSSQTRR
jgi:hypothetical protein